MQADQFLANLKHRSKGKSTNAGISLEAEYIEWLDDMCQRTPGTNPGRSDVIRELIDAARASMASAIPTSPSSAATEHEKPRRIAFEPLPEVADAIRRVCRNTGDSEGVVVNRMLAALGSELMEAE